MDKFKLIDVIMANLKSAIVAADSDFEYIRNSLHDLYQRGFEDGHHVGYDYGEEVGYQYGHSEGKE